MKTTIAALLLFICLGVHAEELVSPAGGGAAEPFLFATRDGVLLSWLEPVAGTDRAALRFARYTNKWSAPRTIVERNDLVVNWADFPSVVEDGKGTLFAHWLQKSGTGTYSYDVRMAVSKNGGATWGAPLLLNRDRKQAEHGFVSLAPLPNGGAGAAWLDGRTGDEMSLRYATVGANGVLQSDEQLDGRTCECCNTGMAMTGAGPFIVYRDRSPNDIRDIAAIRKTASGWTPPVRVHADEWKINGCPVNGPQADAIGNDVVTAWFTAPQDQGRAYVTFSGDGGKTFAKPIRVDDGKPVGRVDVVMLDADTAVVTWLEQTGVNGEIRARRVTRNGPLQPAMKIAESSIARAAGFARIARRGRDVYFAWTELSADTKRIRIRRERF